MLKLLIMRCERPYSDGLEEKSSVNDKDHFCRSRWRLGALGISFRLRRVRFIPY